MVINMGIYNNHQPYPKWYDEIEECQEEYGKMEEIRQKLELNNLKMENFCEKFFQNFVKAWNKNTPKLVMVYIDSFEYEEDFEKVRKAIGYQKTMEILKEHQLFDEYKIYIFYDGGDIEILTYIYDYEIIDFIINWIKDYVEGRSNNEEELKDELQWIKDIVESTLKYI